MPDLAALEVIRTRLPFITPSGDVISVSDGGIYFNARRLNPLDALDLSAALARAVHETAHTNHTNQQESAA